MPSLESVAWWRQPPISLVTLQIGAYFLLSTTWVATQPRRIHTCTVLSSVWYLAGQHHPSKHSTPLLESYFLLVTMPPEQHTVFRHSRFPKLDPITRTSFLLEEARTSRINEISAQALSIHCDRRYIVPVTEIISDSAAPSTCSNPVSRLCAYDGNHKLRSSPPNGGNHSS